MRALRALGALVCLAASSRAPRGAAPPSHPRSPAPAPPPGVEPPPEPALAALPVRSVRRLEARWRTGTPLRVHHEGSPAPARAALRVGRETWLATPGGVLRFDDALWRDPERARPLGAVAGLPSPDVRALAASRDGVWVATARGLSVLGRGPARTLLAGERVTSLAPPWAGTWGGLRRVDGAVATAVPAPAHVTALAACGDALLVGTHDRGLWLRRADGSLAPVTGVPATRVEALAPAGDGAGCRAYAATLRGLFDVRDGVARPVAGAHGHATAALVTDEATYVGSFGDGVRAVDGAAPRAVTTSGRVSALAWDAAHGALLVATDASLQVVRGGDARAVPLSPGPRGRVTALAADGGALWAGTLAHGLLRRASGRWRAVEGFDPRVSALAVGPDGGVWVGTAGGLGRAGRDGARVEPVRDPRGWFSRHVNALRAGDGALWVFVYPGAVAVEFSNGRPSRYRYLGATEAVESVRPTAPWTKELGALSRATVFALAEGGGATWLATSEGLVRAEGGRAAALTELGGALPDRAVHDVARRGDAVWALLWRGGLARWSPRGLDVWSARWQAQPGGLVGYRGAWLVPTEDRGLARVDARGDDVSVTSWGTAEGLSSDAATAVAVAPDGVWVGGPEGVDRLEEGGLTPARNGGVP